MQFEIADLFVVGLGFDLVGGWLLARGLIATPAVITLRTTSYWDSNPAERLAAAEDRIDGSFGFVSLLLGFLLQAVGYALDLAEGGSTAHSVGRMVTALVLLVAAVAVALGAWQLMRPRLLRSLLIELAHWTAKRADEPPVRHDRLSPTLLASSGPHIGHHPRQADEDDWAYATRVFGLTDDELIERPSPMPGQPST